ncbi:MAG: hypothetical protein JEZ04_12050 [Spirochaetales bacterium]|nr:hypothetical protein [Spirochaetales bacterium]
MISEWLIRAFSNIVISHVLSLVLLVGFNYYIFLHARINTIMKSYMILSLGPFLWIIGKLLKTVSPVIGLRWVFIMLQYSGMTILGPAFVIFCLIYLLRRRLKTGIYILLYAPAVICYIFILTNPVHHQFYPVFTFYRDSFGPVFYALKIYIYLCTGLGFLILIVSALTQKRKRTIQSLLFILAAAVPLIGSFYYPSLGNLYSGLRFDIVPLCFNLTFIFFGVAVFLYDFLDISPIAHMQMLNALKEGVVVSDRKNLIVYQNAAASFLTDPQNSKSIRRQVYSLDGKSFEKDLRLESIIDITDENERKAAIIGRTEKIELLSHSIEESIRTEREILYMQQRTEAARELHDVMGHSLTLLIAQLEALKLTGDREARAKRYREIRETLPEWKNNFESVMFENHEEDRSSGQLSDWLKPLFNSCDTDQLSLDFVVKGKEVAVNIEKIRNIYAAVRESLTNSLRHGKADHLMVSITFGEDCRIIIMDNGSGCEDIIEGNGLTGIRKRMESIGGSAEFSSASYEGFITRLTFSQT